MAEEGDEREWTSLMRACDNCGRQLTDSKPSLPKQVQTDVQQIVVRLTGPSDICPSCILAALQYAIYELDPFKAASDAIDPFAEVPEPSNVYLMSGWDGRYKIGTTGDIRKRLRSLRSGCPGIALVHSFQTLTAGLSERTLHSRFAYCRVGISEWFELTDDDVAAIKSINDFDEVGEPS